MSYQYIELTYDADVATLMLNRPAVLNALSGPMISEMLDAIAALRRSEARALILTGRGRAFCSGADLSGDTFVPGAKGAGFGQSVSAALHESYNPLIRDLYQLEIPLVSAVNGVTAGGGLGLALVADICIAARSASFIAGFGPRLGIVPDAGSSWLLARLLGRARALGLAMLGERLNGEQAAAWGLIWRVVEDAALEMEARAIASTLAKGPTRAFPSIRKITDAAMHNALSVHLDLERDYQRALCDSADTIEGVAAFCEKRAPAFTGR